MVAGGVSTGAVVTKGPTKLGWLVPPHSPVQPTGGELTSITSAAVRPKVGVPQIISASFVCRGPLMLSSLTNTILLQNWPLVPGIDWL